MKRPAVKKTCLRRIRMLSAISVRLGPISFGGPIINSRVCLETTNQKVCCCSRAGGRCENDLMSGPKPWKCRKRDKALAFWDVTSCSFHTSEIKTVDSRTAVIASSAGIGLSRFTIAVIPNSWSLCIILASISVSYSDTAVEDKGKTSRMNSE